MICMQFSVLYFITCRYINSIICHCVPQNMVFSGCIIFHLVIYLVIPSCWIFMMLPVLGNINNALIIILDHKSLVLPLTVTKGRFLKQPPGVNVTERADLREWPSSYTGPHAWFHVLLPHSWNPMISFCTGSHKLCRQCWLWNILSPLVWSPGHLEPARAFCSHGIQKSRWSPGPSLAKPEKGCTKRTFHGAEGTFQTLKLTYYCGRLYLLSSCFLVEP